MKKLNEMVKNWSVYQTQQRNKCHAISFGGLILLNKCWK